MKKLLFVMLLLLAIFPVSAQSSGALAYAWETVDLALAYPAGWEPPLEVVQEDRFILQMAQVLAGSVDLRPPGVPFITLTLIPAGEEDIAPDLNRLLRDRLTEIDIRVSGEQPVRWLAVDGVALNGSSRDSLLYGVGQAVYLPGRGTLLIVGRGLVEQQAIFSQFYNLVVNSLVLNANARPNMPQYGVLWRTERTLVDGEDAFLDLVAVTYDPALQRLYALDRLLGAVQIDALTGNVQALYGFDEAGLASDIAVNGAGRVFASDIGCGCLWLLNDAGLWSRRLLNFGPDAPLSVAGGTDNRVYVTDIQDDVFVIHVIENAQEQMIPLGDDVLSQPLLAVDRSGSLLALVDSQRVLRLEGNAFVEALELQVNLPYATDFTVDFNNNLVVVVPEQGVFVFDSAGNVVDRAGGVTSTFTQPGDLVNPVAAAVGMDGTIYVLDGDGSFGAVNALSTQVEAGRIGATHLAPRVEVQGSLSAEVATQTWTFAGLNGERITLTAVANDPTSDLNVALRLLDPTGREVGFNDDHEDLILLNSFDAQIAGYRLTKEGVYTVVVERVDGTGSYTLGLNKNRSLEFDATVGTSITGTLSEALGVDRWVFNGRAGDHLTITLRAQSGDLDPLLRLLNGNNDVLFENDDADEPALGPDAQLVDVRLPASGVYVIEAARYSGTGRYELTLLPVES